MSSLSQELINEFVVAAHFDLDKVKTMLAEHPDLLNENAEWIETPIQAAAHVANRPIAEYLLQQGAPLDICTAAVLGQFEDVDAMLNADPELSAATGAHNIPVLYYPCIGGHLAIAQRLYEAGADINAGEGVNTPLHGAALFGHAEIVEWLLANDANPYAADFNGKTPLDLAAANGHAEVVALLQPFFETGEGAETGDS